MNFKGIKSTQKINGKRIVSGQIVMVRGRFNPDELQEVLFDTDYGFKIQGNNLADAYISNIIRDVSFYDKVKGNLKLLHYNYFD